MIPINYYLGFRKLCELNKNIKVIPSKALLEKLGCEITAMFYLVDSSRRQYNPAMVDPEILEYELKKCFLENEADTKADSPEDTFKVCDECGDEKPLVDFRRKAGRGLNYHNICLKCEVPARSKAMEQLVEKKPAKKETSAISATNMTKYLSIEKAKELVIEAYNIGYAKAIDDLQSESDISADKILKDSKIL